MAKNTQIADQSANAAVAALLALANGGTLNIYDGAQPANANTAVTSQNLLATVALAATAFGAPVGGVAALNPTSPATIVKAGTAAWFRILRSAGNGSTVVLDGSVGLTGGGFNLEFGSVSFQLNAQVAVTGYNYSITEAGQ
jgi:hypothetical protein